jgi:hypothetical protein
MSRVGLVLAFLGSIVTVGAWTFAQAPQQAPVLISGNDLGFQIEGRRGSTPVGKLVVRIDGKWVEAQFSAGPNRLFSK